MLKKTQNVYDSIYQTVKIKKRGKSGNQKYREIWKHGSIAFSHHLIVSTFSFCLRLARKIRFSPRDQPHGLGDISSHRPPAFTCLTAQLPDHHDQLRPLAATLVSGRGFGDWCDTGRDLCYLCGPFPDNMRGWGGPVIKEVLRLGDPLLPDTACVRGGSHTRPGADEPGQG